jgi:hypothetical protein
MGMANSNPNQPDTCKTTKTHYPLLFMKKAKGLAFDFFTA